MGLPRSYLNCFRQSGLSFLTFFSMHAVMRFTFGTYARQNVMASWRQARRWSGVPAAWAADGATVRRAKAVQAVAAQTIRALVVGGIIIRFLVAEP
jgi:hypothetical protein